MVTGWEMVPETAKALSAPVTKLIEVVAAGCGKVYEPSHILRKAKAEGEALVVMAVARDRESDIAVRAANRILDVEVRRQENIDAITRVAMDELPESVSDNPVDADWASRFIREAQDVSQEDVQRLWGKILAGEVTRPGSFSKRTLATVANLGKRDAETFQSLCSRVSKHGRTMPCLFIKTAMFGKNGLPTLLDMQELQAAGLIAMESLSFILTVNSLDGKEPASAIFELPGGVLLMARHSALSGKIDIGCVTFTSSGHELFNIADWTLAADHEQVVTAAIKDGGFTVERRLIVQRHPDGTVVHIPSNGTNTVN